MLSFRLGERKYFPNQSYGSSSPLHWSMGCYITVESVNCTPESNIRQYANYLEFKLKTFKKGTVKGSSLSGKKNNNQKKENYKKKKITSKSTHTVKVVGEPLIKPVWRFKAKKQENRFYIQKLVKRYGA